MYDVSRRSFFRWASRCGAAALGGSMAFRVLADWQADLWAAPLPKREVDHYDRLPGKKIQCHVCPLDCILEDGQTCFCRTRTNHGGVLYTHAYDNPCLLIPNDPVEKVPLNHYRPGAQTLSLATGGCNLRCLYCQNWEQSQVGPEDLRTLDVDKARAVEAAGKKNCDTLAFTYTEPVSYHEWIYDVAGYAKERKVRSVVATAGYIKPAPLRELCKVVDAFAIALKGFDEKYFEVVLGSELKPVLTALETLKEEKVWFEVTTLIVPTLNDDLTKVREQCRWMRKNLGPDVPLHFARFVPMYKLKDLPRTPVQTLEACRDIALEEELRYVYLSNVAPHDGNHTYCPKCRKPVIERVGFKILNDRRQGDACASCGTKLPGMWT